MADYIPTFGTGSDAIEPVGPIDDANSGGIPDFLGGNDTGGNAADSGEFDAAIHVGRDKRNADGSYTRKRGRRGGGASSPGSKKANYSASVDSLAMIIGIAHIGLASAFSTPELALEDAESKRMAEATGRVLQEFDIRPNPKAEAIIGLVICAGSIYGPRAYMINERKKRERANEHDNGS